ncbi:MAG: PAS domain S-box protein [Planctomycetota bacterium]|nr:PAS domain S-box protein [Planctomycetota bacterium]
MVGRKVWEFISPDGAERARRRVEELLKGDAPDRMTEYRLVRPDGGSVWIEVRSKSVTWEGRPAFQSVLRDIT